MNRTTTAAPYEALRSIIDLPEHAISLDLQLRIGELPKVTLVVCARTPEGMLITGDDGEPQHVEKRFIVKEVG